MGGWVGLRNGWMGGFKFVRGGEGEGYVFFCQNTRRYRPAMMKMMALLPQETPLTHSNVVP
jgi:hypothetical protein